MVDEPLHVASRRRVSGAGAMLAVACVVCVGPLSRATRVSAVVCPRFCAQVGQSAREGRSPLSGVSWAWGVTYRGVGACTLLRTVSYIVHSRPDAPRVAARLAVLAGATFHIGCHAGARDFKKPGAPNFKESLWVPSDAREAQRINDKSVTSPRQGKVSQACNL